MNMRADRTHLFHYWDWCGSLTIYQRCLLPSSSVNFYLTTQSYIPEDNLLHTHRDKNLKSHQYLGCLKQFRRKAHPNIFWVHVGQINFSDIHVAAVGPSDAILWLESINRYAARVVVVPRSPRVCHLLVLVPQLQYETDTSCHMQEKLATLSFYSHQ